MRIKKATFICYADPPVAATASMSHIEGSIITPAKAWIMPRSKREALSSPIGEYDWIEDSIKPLRGAEIIDTAWNAVGGLILLGQMPFDYVMQEKVTSLCACIKHRVSCKRNGVTYLSEVTPVGFIPQSHGGGCNPGGYIHFPGAEDFSINVFKCRLDRMNYGNRNNLYAFLNAPKLNTSHAKKYFPNHDFKSNVYLDKYDFYETLL